MCSSAIVIVVVVVVVILLLLLISSSHASISRSETSIACQSDYFRALCRETNEVIVMEQAVYGRMRISRCAKESFGYLGCSNDVLDIMDTHCSGRKQCSLRILDENFPDVKPCHDDLKSYLEVHYNCVRIIPAPLPCLQPPSIQERSGFISSIVSRETGCGLKENPWLLRGLAGQRINVSLVDFVRHDCEKCPWKPFLETRRHDDRRPIGRQDCLLYAIFVEESHERMLCGGRGPRWRSIYLSERSSLEVIFARNELSTLNFLLHFEVVGCPTPEAPKGGWMRMRGSDVVLFGCEDGERWQLVCDSFAWVGENRNCSNPAAASKVIPNSAEKIHFKNLTLGVTATIILLLSMLVWCVIISVGCLCMRRRRRWNSRQDSNAALHITSQQKPDANVCLKHALLCRLHSGSDVTSKALPLCPLDGSTYGCLDHREWEEVLFRENPVSCPAGENGRRHRYNNNNNNKDLPRRVTTSLDAFQIAA